MGWGTIYEVSDDAREVFRGLGSKAEWYRGLAGLQIEKQPQLNAEDSLRFWGAVLEREPLPLRELLSGEAHARFDEYDDPNVVFHGHARVAAMAAALEAKGFEYFRNVLREQDALWERQAWLYGPLTEFLRSAGNRGRAIVVLWEN